MKEQSKKRRATLSKSTPNTTRKTSITGRSASSHRTIQTSEYAKVITYIIRSEEAETELMLTATIQK